MILKGSLPALVTPFVNGKVDFEGLEALVEWHIEEGSHGLVPVGTTGESPTLSHEEHDAVVAAVIKKAHKNIPIIAGAGSNNTQETVRLVCAAKDAGADAALVVTPYYNKPTPDGVFAHFKAAAAPGLPIVIYNIPSRSIIDIAPGLMKKLADIPEIIGVKDASSDIERVSHYRMLCGNDFIQLTGEDGSALGYNAHGGHGCISVVANVAPRLCAMLQEATLVGAFTKARALQDRLAPLQRAIFMEPGLAGAKYGLSLLGRVSNEVRLPLVPVSEKTQKAIREAMEFAGII